MKKYDYLETNTTSYSNQIYIVFITILVSLFVIKWPHWVLLLLAFIGCLLIIYPLFKFYQIFQAKTWPKIEIRVKRYGIGIKDEGGLYDIDKYYYPIIEYEYEYENRKIESNVVGMDFKSNVYPNEADVYELLDKCLFEPKAFFHSPNKTYILIELSKKQKIVYIKYVIVGLFLCISSIYFGMLK